MIDAVGRLNLPTDDDERRELLALIAGRYPQLADELADAIAAYAAGAEPA